MARRRTDEWQIGIDRLLGLGLKYPSGFNQTHLQRL
jgi:hypothetical protein